MDFLCCSIPYGFYSFLIAIILLFVWFALKADGDLTLLFYEKFGKKPNYSGKVIWITGASSGIGEHLAYDLACLGAKLVISGVDVKKLENVKKNCLEKSKMASEDILMLPFLIQDFAVHEKCVEQVLSHFGQIDILVNNAGFSQRAQFEEIDIDVDINMFNINVFGTVNLTRKVLPHFFERKRGQIVVTSSTAGKLGAPQSSSYTGSKHALHGYFECLRAETIQKNISVCLVCPGPVFSSITNRLATGKVGQVYNEEISASAKRMPTSRCSQLMVVAMANRLDECWISQQPILLVYYLAQYIPTIFRSILIKILFSEERVKAMRRGE